MTTKALEISVDRQFVTTVTVNTVDMNILIPAISKKISKAPQLFDNIPIALRMDCDCAFMELQAIVYEFKQLNLYISSVTGVSCDTAKRAGVGYLDSHSCKSVKEMSSEKELIITSSIRSGQRIVGNNRSFIIFGNINPGAEVVADGSIYVYGKILGRVSAGANLGPERIVWSSGLPEFLRIGDKFITADDLANVELNSTTLAQVVDNKIDLSEL